MREKCQERVDWNAYLGRALPESMARTLAGQAVNLLLEIDSEELSANLLARHREQARQWFRGQRVPYRRITVVGNAVEAELADPKALDAIEIVKAPKPDEPRMDKRAGGIIVFTLTEGYLRKEIGFAVDEAIRGLGCRLDQLTAFSPRKIGREGNTRIRVQLNGFQDTEHLRGLLTRVGRLSFHRLDAPKTVEDAAKSGVPSGYKLLSALSGERKFLVEERPIVTEEYLTDVRVSIESASKKPVIAYRLGGAGAQRLAQVSMANVGRAFAVFLDGAVLSAPTLQAPIVAGAGQIDGNFTTEQAVQIAAALRSGPLPVKLRFVP